jgi:exonuclease SbcD
VVPWVEVEVDASDCQNADEVYDSLRVALGKLLAEGKERITALRVRIAGGTDANNELNRDPEQVRNEVISIANECGNGLLWIERVKVETTPKLDRAALLKRDDPIGEVLRIVAHLRQNPACLAEWESVIELQKKLPSELAGGPEPLRLDPAALSSAIEEAEGLLLARLSVVEVP